MSTLDRDSWKNQFLVSMPGSSLAGDYFEDSITLLVDHTQTGAFGLVINRPVTLPLADLLPDVDNRVRCPMFEGGPVEQNRLFFLHSADQVYADSLAISREIYLSSGEDLVEDLCRGQSPAALIGLLGYAGWGAEQLEAELAQNVWLLTPTAPDIVFKVAISERRARAAELLGIDLNLINPAAGHD